MTHSIAKVVYRKDIHEIHLPWAFNLNASEVIVHTSGNSLVLTPCRSSWEGFVDGFSVAEDLFKHDEDKSEDLPRKAFE
ncbi:MAG: hypothetical protein HQL84_11960 [Magnetococcales bacterium]|nr:hypothetical protein [Magnetococcales bacterium]MBF0346023.1 hypothetical protein [Magnetococcales bacterium]MBF0631840.1 hypothetical protein [Magnetococcales bacterium]